MALRQTQSFPPTRTYGTRNGGYRPQVKVIQLIANYHLAEGVSVPVPIDMYYDAASGKRLRPKSFVEFSEEGEQLTVIGFEYEGNIIYQGTKKWNELIEAYTTSTDYIVNAIMTIEDKTQHTGQNVIERITEYHYVIPKSILFVMTVEMIALILMGFVRL